MFIYNETEYPRFIGDIRVMHPSYREGDPLPSGWEAVESTQMPTLSQDEIIEELFPNKVDGVWKQAWAIRPLTQEELLIRSNREQAKRDLINKGMSEAEAEIFVSNYVNS